MLRFVLAILLVTCYYSLGNPVRIVSKQISTSILALENNCRNDFLKKLLKSKINECSDSAPPYERKQLQCLMFYDMSAQLCTAETTSGLTLNEDYTSKINEVMDVNSLCETAKDWMFIDIPEYPGYQDLIQKIHKSPVLCGQICGSDDLTSGDGNFYCKFYKWGWVVIKNHTNTVLQNVTNVGAVVDAQPNAAVADSQPNAATSTNKSVDTIPNASESLDISIKNLTSTDIVKETELSSGPSEKVSEINNIDTKQIIPAVATINKEANHQIITDVKKTENTQQNAKITEKSTSVVQVQNISNPNSGKVATEVQNKNASTIPLSGLGKEELKEKSADKDSVLENPKDKGIIDSEHYEDEDLNSEDGKEGNDDLQGEDDGGDPMINDNVKPLEKKTEEVHKLESIDSTFTKEISQKDFFSGNAQDVGADDDDHFFTFFLTAVVLVVLLYILYHDKSKISKLFFGLLVEGRQGGRRRNSRGHAYRRLDTLEQAISTNTAAPPSKIIY